MLLATILTLVRLGLFNQSLCLTFSLQPLLLFNVVVQFLFAGYAFNLAISRPITDYEPKFELH
jgi:hypothetical protein